ncbi:MAG: hypothetical protein GKR90_26685 [Pseudomonadales bacterium]|nr:hypothetical protein [Pseudomonadales bacterium]
MIAKYSAGEVLENLAKLHGMLHPDGRVNYAALAQRTNIPTPTVSRIHRGSKKWALRGPTIQKLIDAFGITYEQAMGFEPVGKANRNRKLAPTAPESNMLRKCRMLDVSDQEDIAQLVEFKLSIKTGLVVA